MSRYSLNLNDLTVDTFATTFVTPTFNIMKADETMECDTVIGCMRIPVTAHTDPCDLCCNPDATQE